MAHPFPSGAVRSLVRKIGAGPFVVPCTRWASREGPRAEGLLVLAVGSGIRRIRHPGEGIARRRLRSFTLDGVQHMLQEVIPVEVESASRGFLTFELGVNYDDDPSEVAKAFCKRHSLGPEYVPQVEQFVAMVGLFRKTT